MPGEVRSKTTNKASSIIITILLLSILGVLIADLITDRQVLRQSAPVAQWEYRIEGIADDKFDDEMKKLGDAGWEMVFARRAVSGEGYSSKGLYECIFRKPKRQP
jgi:hypothetical protein